MKLKIGAKILLSFTLVLLLLLIMGAVSTISGRSIGVDVNIIKESNDKLSLVKSAESHFYNAVAGLRGYAAYGKDNFKDDYHKEMTMVLDAEERLLELAGAQKQEVQKLIEVTNTYHKSITGDLMPAIAKQYSSAEPEAINAARAEVSRIAGTLVPVTAKLTESIGRLVDADQKIFNEKIQSANQDVARVNTTTIIITIVALIVGIVITVLLTRSIKNPVLEMAAGAGRFAGGDFTREIKVSSSDEIGELAQSLNIMSQQLRALISGVVSSAETLAAHSQELAASAEEVTATIEEVASSTNEVAAMAEKSMENANTTASESIAVVAVAEAGGKTVRQTVEKINSISESTTRVQKSIQDLGDLSTKIDNITNIITGIADQTNLLALNAAIEAARAGEQGRGFAVVAEEVRKLAEQSAGAAREIGQLITLIQSGVDVAMRSIEQGAADVEEGVQLASQAGLDLNNIIVAITKNIELINEIALGAKQTSQGTQQLSGSNEQVSSTIQQVAGSTQELADVAEKLQASVSNFKL
jgi:methyl-accepting chemotaxis protein